jgi:hypothetical protein
MSNEEKTLIINALVEGLLEAEPTIFLVRKWGSGEVG